MLGCDAEPGSRKLTVPSIEASSVGSADAYVPRTGWPTWAVLPAGLLIFAGAALFAFAASIGSAVFLVSPAELQSPVPPQHVLISWLVGLQIGLIVLTVVFAGFFSSSRAQTLALRPPRGGWHVLPLALLPLFAFTGMWTALIVWWSPEIVIGDLGPFTVLMCGGGAAAMLLVIGVGAPLSEELLFRGFLFSGLAKSRLALVGTGILTAVLWTALHAGYSIFGLIEVLAIGLYFSWLLVRTGSLWVPMFCHAVYNTVIGLVLYFVTLPPPA
ncbi:MAG: CPBP family intramembrane metalloprotease [Hyphomicrobium sp.]|nr:CPBP family intramembrane metalloprotease [Hyphomicrobium sp.]